MNESDIALHGSWGDRQTSITVGRIVELAQGSLRNSLNNQIVLEECYNKGIPVMINGECHEVGKKRVTFLRRENGEDVETATIHEYEVIP